jgi:streptothricin acetyltransferase
VKLLSAAQISLIYRALPGATFLSRSPPSLLNHLAVCRKDELAEYLNRPDAGFFVAEVDSSPIGYVVVTQGWNNYAIIEDITVDAPHRGSGVARLMMDAAVEWARGAALAGVRLETQSVNVAACRFYERYGFLLGGHDRYLYRGLHPDSREIALFWYLPF